MIEDDLFIDPNSPILITGYQIRDPEKNKIYFSLGQELGPEMCENSDVIDGIDPNLGIKYIFPKEFLSCKLIASQVMFQNLTDQPLSNVIIRETHMLGTKQLQQFEFKLEFVPPGSVNTWEHQYDPQFKTNKQFVDAAVKGPWNVSTQLFVGDKCHMHTKAMLTFK